MIKRIFASIVILFCGMSLLAQGRAITGGMKITRTTSIKKGVYYLNIKDSLTTAVIIIEGNDLTVDFNNAELKGAKKPKTGEKPQDPNGYTGVAVIVRNSRNVVIKNLKANGYKIALMATNVEKLVLDRCDFSYNYRQRLNSTQEKEDLSDWMSFHHNENDEWLRYGAAIYLKQCERAVVTNCKVTGGQNALMMMQCNFARVYGNDFSFNSGVGVGMYRCSNNEVLYNRLNFNVRGYSHGVYNRGQDSAGILVFEQCNNNLFYKNSVTHSGDGFFLWAGQYTMDTGKGGCNDNIISGNDFSYAPTNGIEVTFSRNQVIDNRMYECDHGIWGGYSYGSRFNGNKFRDNRIGIAIEHGQHNEITYNLFSKDKEAVRLWSRQEQPADWGYARYRDTRSVDYLVAGNSFNSNGTVVRAWGTDSIRFFGNTCAGYEKLFQIDSTVTSIDSTDERIAENEITYPAPPNVPDPFTGNGKYAGRKNIRMLPWGPYDFRSPLIWLTNPTDTGKLEFDILGPAGNWVVKNSRGVESLSAARGKFPATITAKRKKGEKTDIFIELEYRGGGIITPLGQALPAGKPYPFSFRKFFQPLDWDVLFFNLDTAGYNPLRTGQLFSPLARMAPFKRDTVKRLDYAWWGGINEKGQVHKTFITAASAKSVIEPGEYTLSVTWDDAVRVYVDDKLVVDEWDPSKYKFDESPNRRVMLKLGGTHYFRVEHLELGGFATLAVKLEKR